MLATHMDEIGLMVKDIEENGFIRFTNIGGTDSGAIHTTREGVPSSVISIPTRYIHSTVEMAAKTDIQNYINLLKGFLSTQF